MHVGIYDLTISLEIQEQCYFTCTFDMQGNEPEIQERCYFTFDMQGNEPEIQEQLPGFASK